MVTRLRVSLVEAMEIVQFVSKLLQVVQLALSS